MRRTTLSLASAACALAAALPARDLRAQNVPGLTVAPCTVPGVEGPARCGTLEVWENRAARSGRKIPIRFVVLPATGPSPTRDPIFPIAGGPGQSAVDDMAGFAAQELAPLRETRDILLVDQRGTGGSNLLKCRFYDPEADLQAYFGAFYPADRVAACAEEWRGKADLAQYTSDPAADDFDEVRAALGYDRLNLYGVSYGTRAALVYMRRHPDRVRSAILQGVVPTDTRMPLYTARDAQRAVEGVFSECRAQAACAAAFPDLPGSLARALGRFAAGPVEVAIMHPRTGDPVRVRLPRDLFVEGIRYLAYSPHNAALIPAVVHQAGEGDYGPAAEFALSMRRDIVDAGSHGVYLTITCAEDLPFFTAEEGRRLAEGSFLGDYRVRDQKAACAAWPVPAVSREFLGPVASDAPALLLSGQWDPATPPEQAERVLRTLRNARHVVVPSAAHGFFGLTGGPQCARKLVTDFIRSADPRGLDASCADSVRRPPFPTRRLGGTPVTLPADQLARFAGRYRGENGFAVEIRVEGGRLVQTFPDGRTFTLVPVGPARFRVAAAPFIAATFVDEGGRVTGMRIEQGSGEPFTLERVP
ncbi:MAG TPA: alpha/beta fold hydrolase [Longimicrobium sp.]|jgi:pimeloyl-ACP methyl ester carboxylesterase